MCGVVVFLFFHPLENGCLSEVQGVVGMVEARLHFADTQACAFMPRPIKMALSGCYLLGLAVAVQGD